MMTVNPKIGFYAEDDQFQDLAADLKDAVESLAERYITGSDNRTDVLISLAFHLLNQADVIMQTACQGDQIGVNLLWARSKNHIDRAKTKTSE